MSLASQISLLATTVGAKIKIAAPIDKHKFQMFGLLPQASSAAQVPFTAPNGFFAGWTYPFDGGVVNATSTWSLNGHWVGTYTLLLHYAKTTNVGILKVEISKNGGSSWSTLTTTLDAYAAAISAAQASFTAIALPEGSDVLIRITVTGKNASSSAYYYGICAWELTRTGP